MLVIADDPLVLNGLATMLGNEQERQVVGQIGGETDIWEAREIYQPTVLIRDLSLDIASALEQIADAKEAGIPAVALLRDEGEINAARRAGAQGLVVMTPDMAANLQPIDEHSSHANLELTPREMEVLRHLAEGLPNKEIAQRMGISEHTVKFHVNAIMSKMDAQSRTNAVIRATRLGLALL